MAHGGGGARRYLEMRERERWYRNDGRRASSGPVHARQANSDDDYSEEMIRRFLDNLEVEMPPAPPPPSQSWTTESNSTQWSRRRASDSFATAANSRQPQIGIEKEPYWMPPRDIRRELLEAADLLLKAAAEEENNGTDFSADTADDSAFSNYLPQSVFDFRSRAAWRKTDHSPEAAKSDTLESQTRLLSTERPLKIGGKGKGRYGGPQTVFPRIHLPSTSQLPPPPVSQPTSRAPSPAPTLDQLIETLKSSSNTSATVPDGGKARRGKLEEPISYTSNSAQPTVGLNRQVFLVKRYHPQEVPNLISASCSQYDDQFSETSV